MYNVTSVKEAGQIIAALEDIKNAMEGGGGGGSEIVPTPTAQDEGKVLTAGDDGTASWEDAQGGVPTPTLADEGKVLQVIPQTQTTVAPEWATINQVPPGGNQGQVLTKGAGGYSWANPTGGGSTITKEIVSLHDTEISIDTTSSQNAAIVTIAGYHLSLALSTALNNYKILTARIFGDDGDFFYFIDCIGYYFDEKSNEAILYFRNADVNMLVNKDSIYFYFYA